MKIFLLYGATVLIWGSTWLAIKLQLGTVAPEVSVGYRFAIAAVVLSLWCLLRGKSLRFSARDHTWIALQGLLLFSGNYYIFYLASGIMTTGLVAVAFSTIVAMNIFFGALFFKTPVSPRVFVGALIGIGGLALVFWPEIQGFELAGSGVHGLILSLLATIIASLGNMAAARNIKTGLPVMQTNAVGMAYGAGFMIAFAAFSGTPFTFDISWTYVGSILYLALFGSVIAFGCYLTLLRLIGAGRAAYATVLFPIIALSLSSIFEGYRFPHVAVFGVALVLIGNILVLARRSQLDAAIRFVARKKTAATSENSS
ncbi:DMT family transporter [Varunaivibrio sulfuroxidans]|uniref:Threonine/homoserine efflux transporter RhtA n=1 Tax=Varunaivibrio sulfuroxidans TaxID=1773489 RepID=A0A4R3JIY0_9PROT|nr:DMT family transporter [Varunaivibrio sulfuroxidans]TCS64780.1 threonine/homoserine efflux transporter RhtA [Varunaivibrio sulfuroxidans]WES29915.1 DMT family transporter [Varunaivibrio sulfuroxidans]